MITLTIPTQANPANHPSPQLSKKGSSWQGYFQAMASDCQLIFEGLNQQQAEHCLRLACIETWRIESKYSRYRLDNEMARINSATKTAIEVDSETSALLDFAQECFFLSEGLFDITSGVLRKIWKFDGSDKIPSEQMIADIMAFIGWNKVHWQRPYLKLQAGMELDLGGIGKEYAVDKVCQLLTWQLREVQHHAFLVNFGGDLACSGPRLNGEGWRVAVERHDKQAEAARQVMLSSGAIATSGDSRRFLLHQGVRYSHILNPQTGWALTDAPHSVSISSPSCMQAGMLSTLAMLQGAQAEAFLKAQEADYWLQW